MNHTNTSDQVQILRRVNTEEAEPEVLYSLLPGQALTLPDRYTLTLESTRAVDALEGAAIAEQGAANLPVKFLVL
jgi:hypothetical protein